MMRTFKEPMTVEQFRRYVDPRFRTIRRDIRGLKRDVRGLKGDVRGLKGGMKSLREHVDESALETRRHFDVIAESLRSEIRLIAEVFDSHSQRLDDHENRITRLERL
jgi:hypothetical protein